MVKLLVPFMIPSMNNLYFNNPRGGRTLKTPGQKLQKEIIAHLVQNYPSELRYFLPDVPYFIYYRVYFEAVENKSSKTRYKRLDVTNRLKFIEDCLKEAGGVDDSAFFLNLVEKRLAPGGQEKVEIFVWNLEQEDTPIDPIRDL